MNDRKLEGRGGATMNRTTLNWTLAGLGACALLFLPASAVAQVPPEGDVVAERGFAAPGLYIPNAHQPLSRLPADLVLRLQPQLDALGVGGNLGLYDLRAGRWGGLVAATPLVPGAGVGNNLAWAALGQPAPVGDAAYQDAVWQAFRTYLQAHQAQLGIDTAELGSPSVGSYENGRLVHVSAGRVVNGVPVRSSMVSGTLNSGNLVLFGTRNWGTIDVATTPALSADQAQSIVAAHLAGFTITGWRKAQLVLVPTASGDASPANEGQGYDYRLAWAVGPQVQGSLGGWEGLVDAHSGELLSFSDTNQYLEHKKVICVIFSVSNDG